MSKLVLNAKYLLLLSFQLGPSFNVWRTFKALYGCINSKEIIFSELLFSDPIFVLAETIKTKIQHYIRHSMICPNDMNQTQNSKCYCYSENHESYQKDCFATSYKSALRVWLFWRNFAKSQIRTKNGCKGNNSLIPPRCFLCVKNDNKNRRLDKLRQSFSDIFHNSFTWKKVAPDNKKYLRNVFTIQTIQYIANF